MAQISQTRCSREDAKTRSRRVPSIEEAYEAVRGAYEAVRNAGDAAHGDREAKKELRWLQAAMAIVASQLERTCVHCGCTDSRACEGGCSWAVKHKHTPTGVCSRCVPRAVKEADRL